MPRTEDSKPVSAAARSLPSPAAQAGESCRFVQILADEMVALVGERIQLRGDCRRTRCHTRQIAMYVCHVALQIPQTEIGAAFGKDRSTVGYACSVVEDRRDNRAFDDFVAMLERITREAFAREGRGGGHA